MKSQYLLQYIYTQVQTHLQWHQSLPLQVGRYICRCDVSSRGRKRTWPSMLQTPFVFLIQQSRKCKYIQKQQRGSHCNGHGEFSRVVLSRDTSSIFLSNLVYSRLWWLRSASLRAWMTCTARRPNLVYTSSVRKNAVILESGTVCEGGYRLKELINVMQVRNQLEPEGDLGCTVVVSDTGLEANVEVQLLFRCVFRPRHFFKAIRLCVDELSILRNWLVWITVGTQKTGC